MVPSKTLFIVYSSFSNPTLLTMVQYLVHTQGSARIQNYNKMMALLLKLSTRFLSTYKLYDLLLVIHFTYIQQPNYTT